MLPLVLGLGCSSPSGIDDSAACQQTYEFGNSGCLEVTGEVVNAAGQPLRNVSVAAHAVSGDVGLTGTGQVTDSTGQFRFRLMRMFVLRSPSALPDTVSMCWLPTSVARRTEDQRVCATASW